MKIWHISDTHTFHGLLNIPDGIDMVIHSGDCSNPSNPYNNEPEVREFIDWYSSLPIKHKVFVAGNHDTSIEKRLIRPADFTSKGIIYLENASTCIEGLNIWGTPYTPTFGVGWAYNRSRDKMDKLWKSIPENTDIVVSHGPPKGILDLSYNRENQLEFCGCGAMKKHMLKIEPKLVLFGHIHNCESIINAGTMQLSGYKTTYSNGSVVTDGKFGKLSSHGNIFEIVNNFNNKPYISDDFQIGPDGAYEHTKYAQSTMVFKGEATWGRSAYIKLEDNKVIFDCSDEEYGPIVFDIELLRDALNKHII